MYDLKKITTSFTQAARRARRAAVKSSTGISHALKPATRRQGGGRRRRRRTGKRSNCHRKGKVAHAVTRRRRRRRSRQAGGSGCGGGGMPVAFSANAAPLTEIPSLMGGSRRRRRTRKH